METRDMATSRVVRTDDVRVADGGGRRNRGFFDRRRLVETKSAFKTTELLTLVLGVAGLLIAAQQLENLDGERAWTLVTVLAAAYMISRGLAKLGKGHWDDD